MNRNLLVFMMLVAASSLPASAETTGRASSQRDLLDIFPPSVVEVPEGQRGMSTVTTEYSPSESLWTEAPGLDEKKVFDLLIQHQQDKDNSFDLRIGKGGQIYSLRGSFGESLNPQKVEANWNDGVWQPVCHPTTSIYHPIDRLPEEMAKPIKESGYAHGQYIHGAGTYTLHGMDSGNITVSFDVLLDPDNPGPLSILMRDAEHGRPMLTFGALSISSRHIDLNGKRFAAARPGEWQHIQLTFSLDDDTGGSITASVRNKDGQNHSVTAPFSATDIRSFTWFGFSGAGEKEGVAYVDNLEIEREHEGHTEWPIRYDFEEGYEKHLQLDHVVVGADEEKGARIQVTDRVAASGKQSLEIRDAAGLEAGWQPLLRLWPHSTLQGALYSPKLASEITGNGRVFRTVNWGLVPQLKTISRSPILYYTQIRNVGDGIIEMTYIFHNFSVRDDIDYGHLNTPWGSTRFSSLPHFYVNSPDGELMKYGEFKGAWTDPASVDHLPSAGIIDVRKTGGWNLNCASEADDAPSLALVFGRDRHLEAEQERAKKGQPFAQFRESAFRFGIYPRPDDWQTRPENSWENWFGQALLPKLHLKQGNTVWYRYFFVINRKDRAIELADSLVDKVDYGRLIFDADETPKVPVYVHDGKVVDQGDAPTFFLFTKPVTGTMPLFLIENQTTGQEVVTTDPYIFVPQKKMNYKVPDGPEWDIYRNAVGYDMQNNNSQWKQLLGYAFVEKPETGEFAQLSELLDEAMFPEANTYHLNLWVERNPK